MKLAKMTRLGAVRLVAMEDDGRVTDLGPVKADLADMNFNDALGAPILPPREWLTEIPDWLIEKQIDGDITVILQGDELGRAAAIYYDHDVCYMNEPGECWKPPASPTANEAFLIGTMPYEQFDLGDDIHIGAIPIRGGHTSTDIEQFDDAVAARNDTPEDQRLVGTLWDVMLPRDINDPEAGERQVGLFLGAVVPETTIAEAMMINRSGLSGEWWPREGFTATDGTLVEQLVLDAMGPVLVTKAAIPTNRDGQTNANVDFAYSLHRLW